MYIMSSDQKVMLKEAQEGLQEIIKKLINRGEPELAGDIMRNVLVFNNFINTIAR